MKGDLLHRVLFFLLGFYGLSACTININDPNANQNVNRNANAVTVSTPLPTSTATALPTQSGWTVVVCTSRVSEITLQAGPSEADSQTFATWKVGNGQRVFELPERLQNLNEIHFQAISSEANPVELCVLYNGRPKKRVAFDEGSENHTVGASDDDDNDCRCTQ